MSEIGDKLAGLDAAFNDALADDLEVTNFEDSSGGSNSKGYEDRHSNRTETTASPVSTTGTVEPARASTAYGPAGIDVEFDVTILLDGTVTVSAGADSDPYPYPSEVKHLPTGRVFRVSAVIPEGNGLNRLEANHARTE